MRNHGLIARVATFAVSATIVTAILSCTNGGGTTTTTGSISIALSPTSGSAAQGGSVTTTAIVTDAGSFTGQATITTSGAPTGVTATVGTAQLSSYITTAVVTVVVGAAVTPGTYALTVTAGGQSVTSVNATFTLTVTSSSTPGFSLAALPTVVSVAQNASATTTLTVNRSGGFTGSVALTATGMSNGLTASFNPTATTGNSSVLTLTTTAGATPGTVTLTIRGTATGLADQTTTVLVTVTALSGGNTATLNYSGCAGVTLPLWVAYQDGTGAWTRVTGTNNVYQFPITSGKGGIATVGQSGTQTIVSVNLATNAELTGSPIVFCPGTATTSKSVSATPAGLGASDIAFISLGGANGYSTANGTAAFLSILSGTQDLVAYRTALIAAPAATDRAVLMRDLNVANGGATPTVDFSAGTAIVPAAATFTIAGPSGSDAKSGSMGYYTGPAASCTYGNFYTIPSTAATSLPLFGIPATPQRATDFHIISLTAINGSGTRTYGESFHTFADRVLTLGAVMPAPTVTALTQAGYKRLQAVGTIPADYVTSGSLTYTQQGTAKSAVITATLGWLGGTSATLAFPDFAALSGWDNSWMPAAGSTVDWSFAGNDVNYVGIACSEGARIRFGRYKGTN